MIVVADASPLRYLIVIDQTDLLPNLLGQIVVPDTVYRELQADRTPDKVVTFLKNSPDWLTVMADTGIIDYDLFNIDPGEREGILLAERMSADLILVDDRAAGRVGLEGGRGGL